MKTKIRDINFRPESLERIEQMVSIIEEYQQQGLRLSARQLYYQFVSRGYIANKDTEYKKLTALLTDARYAGMVDWDIIEDRGREPSTPNEWDSLEDRIKAVLRNYRLPRWRDQPKYVELWVEKQALAGVLAPIAYEFHATLMVNKGYSSASAMKESADRIKTACIIDEDAAAAMDRALHYAGRMREEYGEDSEEYFEAISHVDELPEGYRAAVILYLGDLDPSGEDMVRDIKERLKEFGVLELSVEKIALTMAQVKQYNPPPNPAKITDPRAKDYIAKYGNKSWEVDALPPPVLTRLIRAAFAKHVDKDKLAAIKAQEEADKDRLRAAVEGLS